MYDKDDSGTIELSEMTDIIGTLYDMEGVTSSGGEGNISKQKRYDLSFRLDLYFVFIID